MDKAMLTGMATTLACYAEVLSETRYSSGQPLQTLITGYENDGDPRFEVRVDGYGDLTVCSRGLLTMNQARTYLHDTACRLGRPLQVEVHCEYAPARRSADLHRAR